MIFLTAPLDVQQSPVYESALNLLRQRHDHDQLAADRDLFSDMEEYNKSWKKVYDPEKAEALYLLAREDGTIGLGTYRQWKWLSKKHGVPATSLLSHGENAAEVGEFMVSVIEGLERSDQVFALVSPEPARSGSSEPSGVKHSSTGSGL